MPGIELFNRRWNIGSDDLFYPCILELGARVLWISLHVSFYLESRQTFSCAQDSLTSLLHYYYISFFAIATALALDTLLIVIISTRGTITNSRPRRHVRPLLYARLLLYFMDLLCSVLGLYLLFTIDWAAQQCSKFILASMIANCVFCWLGIIVLVIPGIILLDPISHLPERDVAQKRRILYQRIKRLFFCCTCCLYDTAGSASRSLTYENSYKQISNLLEMIFRGGDLTPSDVLAGIILLSNKEIDQYKREGLIYAKQMKKNQQKLSSRPPIVNIDDDEDEANEEGEGSKLRRGNNNKEPAAWMNVNEASHYVRYAVACYSWPYYLYMNSLKGLNDLYCSSSLLACCCGCCGGRPDVPDSAAAAGNTTEVDGAQGATEATRNVAEAEVEAAIAQAVIHGDPSRNHMKAFKILARVDECDVVYANFNNELFFVPFCILVDHAKKAVVIAIRGTLSMRDVITDITAECGYFDVDHLVQQPVHIGILNTAENILQTIETHDLLKESFRRNPDYKLLVTGHSLGAGTAVILSLKLKKEYPNVRCIAYSPPGGLISKDLADYSRSFIMSVIVGDDIVPRLSIRSVHNLKADILKELYSCEMPKYKILWKYSISCFRSPTPDTERQENGEAEASSESSSGVSSGNNSMLIDGDDVEDQYLQHAAATTSANVTTVQPGAVLDNEDDDGDQDKLKLSSNSGSSQRKLIVFNESDEIIEEDEKKKEELPKKTLFKAAAMAVARESQERLRSARKILRRQNGGEAASSSATAEAAAAAKAEAEDTLNKPIKSVQDCVAAYQKVKKMMHTVYTTYPDLQLPGHILYIYRIHNATFGNPNNHPTSRRICSRLCSCCKRTSPDRVKPDELAEYDSRWADRDEFKKILITNRIIMDHFPNTVDNALKYFSNSSGPYLGTASSRSSTAAFIS